MVCTSIWKCVNTIQQFQLTIYFCNLHKVVWMYINIRFEYSTYFITYLRSNKIKFPVATSNIIVSNVESSFFINIMITVSATAAAVIVVEPHHHQVVLVVFYIVFITIHHEHCWTWLKVMATNHNTIFQLYKFKFSSLSVLSSTTYYIWQ